MEDNHEQARLPILDVFITDLRAIWERKRTTSAEERTKLLLKRLVSGDGLKTHSSNGPPAKGYKNLLLYVDPDHHSHVDQGRDRAGGISPPSRRSP